jgi:methylphosphotriester-DNA--protein-cysteine methyltransferase
MSSGLASAAEFAGRLPAPPTVSLAWSAFTLHVSEPPLHTTAAFADHLLASRISGRCRLRQAIGGRAAERWSGPGAIDANLHQPVALHHLAGLAGVSTRHFERAFRQATGVAPHTYVLRKRVDAARHLLLHQPTIPIEEIAVGPGSAAAPSA